MKKINVVNKEDDYPLTGNNSEYDVRKPVSGDNIRFKCNFSEKAIKHNFIMASLSLIPLIILFGFICIKFGKVWFLLPIALIFSLLIVGIQTYMKKIVKESYLEITADGRLICKFFGYKEVSYPILHIQSVEKVTIEEAANRYATVPLVLNIRGGSVLSSKGVLITFDRVWIKSVFPVYFNPADVDGFISTVKAKMETG